MMIVAMAIFLLYARHGKDYVSGPVALEVPSESL
jgi:hypothetical protein